MLRLIFFSIALLLGLQAQNAFAYDPSSATFIKISDEEENKQKEEPVKRTSSNQEEDSDQKEDDTKEDQKHLSILHYSFQIYCIENGFIIPDEIISSSDFLNLIYPPPKTI
jgi:hypothetical protein